jgi:hypothetical protein
VKRTHACLFCLTLLACADGGDDTTQIADNASTTPLTFETNTRLEVLALDEASCSGEGEHPQSGFEVYQDKSSFAAAYRAARPGAAQVPDVDFVGYVVVGAFLGLQTACGAEVSIESATNMEERVEVDLKVTRLEGCAGAAALSFPFAFARLNRIDKPYVSVEHSEIAACSAP